MNMIVYYDSGFPKGIILEVNNKPYSNNSLNLIKKHYTQFGFTGKFVVEKA